MKIYQFLIEMLPDVVKFLKENNQSDSFKQFFTLVKHKEFPSNQIAYLLFLDVVKLLGSDNTSQMRYTKEIKQFWQIGSLLFYGKKFRFMSGEKSIAKFLGGDSTKFNFSVPSRSVLNASQVYQSTDIC